MLLTDLNKFKDGTNNYLLKLLIASLFFVLYAIDFQAQVVINTTICPNSGVINIGQNAGFSNGGNWSKQGDPTFVSFGDIHAKTTTVTNLDLGLNVLLYNDGNGNTLTQNVTNYEVFAGNAQTQCSTGATYTFQLAGSNPGTYGTGQWIVIAGNAANITFDNVNAYNAKATISQPGIYTLQWLINFSPSIVCNGTNTQSSANVVITLTGPVFSISNVPSTAVCPATNTTLTVPAGYNYLWDNGTNVTSRTVAPNSTTTYSVTATDGSGCKSVRTATINVNNYFTVSSSASSYCQGTSGVSIKLSGSETGMTYLLTKGAANVTSIAGNGASLTWLSNLFGTYKITGTNNTTGCSMDMGTITILENPLPPVNAGADVTGCAGTAFNLSASGATSYLWNTSETISSITVAPASTTTYTVTGTINSTGCSAADNVVVTINPLPVKYNVSGSGSYCQNGAGLTVTLSGSEGAAVNYQLLKDGIASGVSKAGTGGAMTWTGLTAATYTILATKGTCTAIMNGSAVVSEVATPLVYTLTGPTSYCANLSGVTLSLSGSQVGVNYTLKKGGVSVSTLAGTGGIITWPNSTTGLYTVDAETASPIACSTSMNGTVTVNSIALPIANAGADVAICSGKSVQLNASGGLTYAWAPAAGLSSTNVLNPVATPAATTTYTVTVSNASGCLASDQVVVTLRALPDAVASTPATICNGDKAILTATDNIVGNNETYVWSNGATKDTIIVSPSTSGLYFVTITDANGCINSTSTSVTVNQGPGVNAGSDIKICTGGSLTLNGNGDADTWLWSNGATTLSTSITPATTTNYILKGTYNATGCSTRDTVKVTVNPPPVVSFTLNGANNTTFCSNGPLVTLAGTPAGGLFSSTVAGAIAGTSFDPFKAGVGIHTITYSYTDANGCTGTTSVNVEVLAPPVVSITGLNASYCNSAVPFTVSGNPLQDGSNHYGSWAFSGPLAAKTDNLNGTCTIDPSKITVAGLYTLTYSVANSGGCVNSVSQTFNLKLAPGVNIVGLPTSICQNGTPVTITGNQGTSGLFTGLGITDNLNGTALFNPSLLVSGIYNITFSYTDLVSLCTGSITKPIQVQAKPSIFSVNGGGAYCAGGAGLNLDLSGSTAGLTYELFVDGITTGQTVLGTGGVLSFINEKASGIYTIKATDNATNCNLFMNGSATVVQVTLPLPYNLSGASTYCAGGNGVTLSLSGSQIGVNYTLYKGGVAFSTVAGSGGMISWPNCVAGVYTADAVTANPISCPMIMNGSVTVTTNPAPVASAGADVSICAGSSVTLGASGGQSYSWSPAAGLNNVNTGTPVASPVTSTLYTVTVTDNQGCSSTDQVLVNVHSLPDAIVSAPVAICNGEKVVLTATDNLAGTGESYLWSNGAVKDTIIVQPNITTNYTVTITDVFGCKNSATTNVAVNPEPGINAGSDVQICQGSVINLIGSGNADTWLWNTGATTLTTNVSPALTTNYILKGTYNATGCYTMDTVKVTVNTLPVVTFTLNGANNTSFCSNGALVTLAGTPAGGSFSSTAAGAIAGTSFDPFKAGTGIHTITYSYTNANGCTGTTSTNVEVIAPPVVTITGLSASYCNSVAPFTISGNPLSDGNGHPGTWLFTGPSAAFTDNVNGTCTIDPSKITVQGTYSLTYIVDNSSGCTSSVTKTFLLKIGSSLSIVGLPTSICQNSSAITISGNQGASGTFSGPGIVDNLNGTAAFDPSSLTPGASNVIFSFTDPVSLCASNYNQSIAINPSAVQFSVNGGGAFCAGGAGINVGLSGSTAGWTYELQLDGFSTGIAVPGTGAPISFGSLLTGGAYTVKAVNYATTCNAVMNGSATVTVNTLPLDAQVINGISSICPGSTQTFSVPAIQNANTYVWQVPANATISSGAGTSSVSVYFDPNAVSGNVSVYGQNGCGSGNPSSLPVTIKALPSAAGVITGSNKVCQGEKNVSYSVATIPGANSYQWTVPAGGTIVSGQGTEIIVVDYNINAVSGSVSVLGVNSCGNGTASSLAIAVAPKPQLTKNAPSGTITCTGNSVTVSVTSSTGGVTYAWAPINGGNITSVTNLANATVDASGGYVITVTEPANSCTSRDTVFVISDIQAPQGLSISSTNAGNITCLVPKVTLTAGTTSLFPVSYQWTPTSGGHIFSGGNIANAIVDKAGVYEVKVTNLNTGCSTVKSIVVTETIALPDLTVTDPDDERVTCSKATVTLNASSATSGVSYLWNGPGIASGGTTAAPVVNSIGSYSVTITAPNGCVSTASVQVLPDATVPTVNVNTNPPLLTCSATSISLSGSSTTAGATLLWNGPGIVSGATTQTPVVNFPGTYTLTATHPTTGCTISAQVNVSQDKVNPTVTFPVLPGTVTCGQPSVTIAGVSSAVNNSYAWSTINGTIKSGATLANVVVSKGGTYALVVTNTDNGCSGNASIIVNENTTPPDAQIATPSIITCSLPSIQLGGSSVTAATNASWSTSDGNIVSGPLTFQPVVDKAGTYVMVVTDANNQCIASASVYVSEQKTKPVISIDKNPMMLNCVNTKVTLSGTATGATLSWTGPAGAVITNPTSPNPIVDEVGRYYLTATNANGCSSKDSTDVAGNFVKPQNLTINAPAVLTCSANSVSLTGSSTTASVTYNWAASGGGNIVSASNTGTISVNAAGTYKMIVTDPTSFCKDSTTVTVSQDLSAPVLTFPSVPSTITCTQATSTLNASVSVVGSTLLWTGPGTISDPTIKNPVVNAAGTYTLKATHPVTGCWVTSTLVVPVDKVLPDLTIAAPPSLTCLKPSVKLDATTSVTNFTAQWSTANGNIVGASNTIDVIADKDGLYTLQLTNNDNGCISTGNILVTPDRANPAIMVDPSPVTLTCTKHETELFGTSTTVGSSLLWSGPGNITGPISQKPKVDAAGTYTLTVTGTNGCVSTATVNVVLDNTAPGVPGILPVLDLTCKRKTVNLEVSPVPLNVDYLWTTAGSGNITNAATSVATVDAIGTYTVMITDRTNGCFSQNSVIVNEDKSISDATLVGGPYELTCSSSSIQLQGSSVTGINPAWTASSGGHIVAGGTTLKPTVDAMGTYTFTVENPVTGCLSSNNLTVTKAADLPLLKIDPFPLDITCSRSQVTLYGQPDEVGTTYAWTANPGNIVSGGATYNPVVDKAGAYILTVTKTATGCKSVAAIEVKENKTSPQAVIGVPEKLTCTRTQIQLNASSPVVGATAAWTTSGTGSIRAGDENAWSPIVYTKTTYNLTVTDPANSCTSVLSIVVDEDISTPNINVNKSLAPLTCTTKQVVLSGNSITSGATYLWTTAGSGNISNPASKTPSVDATGIYTLLVTNPANGCTANDFVNVTDNIIAPQIWVNPTPSILNCIRDTVQIKGSSTTSNVTYLWTGPGNISNATTKEPFVDAQGAYTLKVTDGINGCFSTSAVTVVQNKTIPAAPLLTGNAACLGAAATSLSATGNSIQWYSNAILGSAYKVGSGATYSPASLSAAGDYSFYATQKDATSLCESPAAQITYTIRSLPVAPVNTDKTICEGSTDKLLVSNGINIKWYSAPGGAFLGLGTYTPAVTAPGTYTYYTTQTDGFGCESATKNISLIIQPTPAKPVVNPGSATVCYGLANPAFGASGSNLQWYTSPTLPAPVKTGGTFTPLETSPGTYSYYVTQTSVYGCVSPYETVSMTIRSLPQMFTVTGGGIYCQGGNGLTVGLSGSELNVSYQLLLNGTTVTGTLTGTGNTLDFGLQKSAGNYTVKATDANSCQVTMTGGVSIAVNPLPANAPTVTGLTSVCEGATDISYQVPAIANASSYTWNIPSGASIASGLNTRSITVDFGAGAVTGQVSVYASNSCGNGLISPNLQVVVNPLPVASGNIKYLLGNNHICLGDSGVIYEVDPIANATSYDWLLPSGATIYTGNNSRQIRVKFAANAAIGNQYVKVRGVNSCGTGAYSTPYAITVYQNPSVYAGIDQNICSTQTSLQGSAIPGGGSGTWAQIFGYSVIANNAIPNSQVISISQGVNSFTWKVTYNGCSSIDTVNVMNNILNVDAGENLPVCSQEITLKGTPNPLGTNGIWTLTSGSASFVDASVYNTKTSSFGYGDNKLFWTITKNGCASRDSIIVTSYRPVAPDAGADQTLCFANTKLAAITPVYGTGQWSVLSGQATFTNANDPKTAVTQIGKGKNRFLWTVTNMICTLSDTVVVINNELDVNAGYDQVVCDNRTTLNATQQPSGAGGQWSVYQGSASFLDNSVCNTKVSGLVTGDNKLIWSVSHGNCVNTDTVTIVSNMPTIANAGPDQFLASGNGVMDGNTPVVGTGQWSVLSGAAAFTDQTLFNSVVNGLNPGANTLRWTITYKGCYTFDDVVYTNGTIEKVDAGQDQVICTNYTTLEATRPQYGFGSWTVQKGSANFDNNELYNAKVTNLGTGTNILRWSVKVSSIEFYDTVIIVNNQPSLSMVGPRQVLCIDSSALSGNIPIQGTGRWTLEGGSAIINNPLQFNSKVTSLGNGDNLFRWTITKGNCVSSSVLLISNDKTSIANAGLDQTICDDKSTLIPEPAYIGTGEWSVVSGSGMFDYNEVTGLARGKNILRWTIRKNNCSSYDDMIVISNKPTTASAGLNTVVCTDSLFLAANKANATIGEIASWSIMNGSGIIKDSTLNTSLVKRLAQGVNVLRWTINNHGCISYSDVKVNYAFVKSDAGIDNATCDNHLVLSANNPTLGTGEWSIVGGSGAAVFTDSHSPNTEVKNLDQGKNILRWTINNFSCSSASEVIITNNAPSVAYAGGDQTLCVNTTTMGARQSFIGKGTWSVLSGSGMFADSSAFNSKVYNVGTGVNTFRWTLRNLNCYSSDEVVIQNNKPLGTFAGTDQTLCTDSTSLSANQPIVGSGVWSIIKGAGQLKDAYNAVTYIQKLAADTNIIRWTITNKQCSESLDIKLVNNKPTIPLAGADRTLCSDQTLMDGNMPVYGVGEWLVISGSGTFTTKNKYNTEVKGLTQGNNIFRWRISKQGCVLYDDVMLVNDLPTKPDAGTDIAVCDNNSPLYANKPAIGTGYWSLISGSGAFIDSTQYNTRIVGLGQGSNLLTWTTTHNRCLLSDVVEVKNNQTNVFAGPDQTIFVNSSILVGNDPQRGIGTWVLSGGGGNISSPNNYESFVNGLSEGLNTFLWSVDIDGCISSDAVQITYYMIPTASFAADKLEGCPPLEVKFTKTTLGNYPFSWQFGEDGDASLVENPTYTYDKPGKYIAKLSIVGPDGKTVYMNKTITVFPVPKANFDVVSGKIYIPEDELRCFNYSEGSSKYQWDFGDGETSDELNPAHLYKDSGIYSIKLKVWTNYECTDSMTIENALEVIESTQLRFPSAFTPNPNGGAGGTYNRFDYSNDVFYPILVNGEIEDYHMEIYNRWGVLLFESKDINLGWDGYYKGNLMREDVYVFRVTGKRNSGKKFSKTGDFLLMHKN